MSVQLPSARRALLWEVSQRVPSGRSGVYVARGLRVAEAIEVPVTKVEEDVFYEFEENTARAFADAVIEWAARTGGGRLTVTCPDDGEFRSHRHRWQKIALRFEAVRLLTVDPVDAASDLGTRVEAQSLRRHPMQSYRLVLREGKNPVVFVARYAAVRGRRRPIRLGGFLSLDAGVVGELAEEVELFRHRAVRELRTWAERELVHRTTQRVYAELVVCRKQWERLRRTTAQPAGKKPARVAWRELEKIFQRALAMVGERRGDVRRV